MSVDLFVTAFWSSLTNTTMSCRLCETQKEVKNIALLSKSNFTLVKETKNTCKRKKVK